MQNCMICHRSSDIVSLIKNKNNMLCQSCNKKNKPKQICPICNKNNILEYKDKDGKNICRNCYLKKKRNVPRCECGRGIQNKKEKQCFKCRQKSKHKSINLKYIELKKLLSNPDFYLILTEKQKIIANYVFDGFNYKQIAEKTNVSKQAVSELMKNITKEKLTKKYNESNYLCYN